MPFGSSTYLRAAPWSNSCVAPRRVVERDRRRVDRLGDLHPVVQDRHHQLAVVAHDRALAGGEGVRLGPAEADPDGQRAVLGRLVRAPGSPVTYRPGMPSAPPARVIVHQRVEHGGRALLLGVRAVAAGLEADRVDGRSRPRARRGSARSGPGSPWDTSMVSQPKVRACASRSLFRSPTITTAAPSSERRVAAAASPTGPGAGDVDGRPGLTPALTQPWKPVGKMSESMARSRIFSIAWSLSGNLSRFQSA